VLAVCQPNDLRVPAGSADHCTFPTHVQKVTVVGSFTVRSTALFGFGHGCDKKQTRRYTNQSDWHKSRAGHHADAQAALVKIVEAVRGWNLLLRDRQRCIKPPNKRIT
jgi:hypothetical protein